MLSNYLKIAWRNIVRNKLFSAINILGLALSMAGSLLILLWIQDERSVDAYHVNGPRLYNVMQRMTYSGKTDATHATPGILADELKRQLPEIEYAAGYTGWDAQMTLSVGDRINKAVGHWAGADWFRMFSIPLLAGTPETALRSPIGIALSHRLADLYFGSPQTALGKSIRIDNKQDYQVTAVFEDLPVNASDHYDFLLNWTDCLNRNEWMKSWGNNGPHTRIMLRAVRNGEPADVTKLNAKLKPFLRKYDKDIGPTFDAQLFLQAYPDSYLYSNFKNGQPDGGRVEYVRLFGMVAVFLLLIACINFMNLSTARSVKRAREIGVRKVIGAVRRLLIGQFLGEAVLFAGLAGLLALTLVFLLLPAFNTLTGKHIALHVASPSLWLILLGTTLLTGLLAGSYPALFLSGLEPVKVLKSSLRFGAGARLFRQGLVVFQFVLSTLLIVGTLVVYRQVHFIQTQNLGFVRENLLYVPIEGDLATGPHLKTFRDELLRTPGVQAVTSMEEAPTTIGNTTGGITWPGKNPSVTIEFTHTAVGYDWTKTLNARLLAGRDFSPAFGTDTANYLINQATAAYLGYNDPVGQPLTMWGRTGTIIGLLEDFHFQSMHTPIAPLIVRLGTTPGGQQFLIRTRPGQTAQVLAGLETLWKQRNPKFPFTYRFADDEYQKLYRSESVISGLSSYFAFLGIFISCLGLFGLASFTAEQRRKEIGVRKVLGASVTSIVTLLSSDFLKLVLMAILIASPLAYYTMNRWLSDFAYRTELSGWVFAGAGGLAVSIALLTVSYQSIRAALTNPVKALRSE